MDVYLIVKTLHVLSATVLFGTGLGIAFFMLRSHFTPDLREKYFAARTTVLADYLFESQWEDGSPRQTATMTMMSGPASGFKMVVNDRAMKRSLWVLAESIDDLLASAELLLADEDTPWVLDVVKQQFRKS